MEECYEYYDCNEMDCSKRKNNSKHCWDLECDLCHTHSPAVTFLRESFGDKKEACKQCLYYQFQTKT